MQMLVLSLAVILHPYDPREYVEFEGVLMPINGPAVIAHLISCVLMFAFIGVIALRNRPDPRGSENGDQWPRDPRLPMGPRWSSGGGGGSTGVGRLMKERHVVPWPSWN